MKTLKIYSGINFNKGIRNIISTFSDVADYIIRNGYDFGLNPGDCMVKINFDTKELVMFAVENKGLEYIEIIKKHLEYDPSYVKTEETDDLIVFEEKYNEKLL